MNEINFYLSSVIFLQLVIIFFLARYIFLLKEKMKRDPLTGLLNRRALNDALEEKSGRFAFLMLDIDYFKTINDKMGHPVGDSVLKGVANRISGSIRPHDISFRYGGEEFAVIISAVDKQGAEEASLRLQERLRKPYRIKDIDNQSLDVRVSMGLTIAKEEDSPERIIKRADRALYRAKETGRDRLEIEY
ncbi:MAG: GGDEF domain-containing protein [Candidatus Paceibacterota bacterium]